MKIRQIGRITHLVEWVATAFTAAVSATTLQHAHIGRNEHQNKQQTFVWAKTVAETQTEDAAANRPSS